MRSFSGASEIFIVAALAGLALIFFGFFKFRYGGEVVEGGRNAFNKDGVQHAMKAITSGDINKLTQFPGAR